VLTGPPIAGQLIQKKDGGFLYAQIFAGADMLVGCAFLDRSRGMQKTKAQGEDMKFSNISLTMVLA